MKPVKPTSCTQGAGTAKVVPLRSAFAEHTVSAETIEELERLLREAKAGDVIGLCYAAMHKRRQYTVHSCGEAYRNPTFCRGMVATLDDHLGAQINAL